MPESKQPANLDLYQEQTRQGTMLESVQEDVREIKDCLIGDSGLIIEVDRLKRSNKLITAACWFVFTSVIGATIISVVAQQMGN